VDLMVICSCPPDVSNPAYTLANGERLTLRQLGPAMACLEDTGRALFGAMIDEQAAWLGVPAVNSVGVGSLRLRLPHASLLMAALLPQAPWLIRHLPHSRRIELSCDVVPGCKIVDGAGRPLAERAQAQGEGMAVAEVALAEARPTPAGPQPRSRLPLAAYMLSDGLLPAVCALDYWRGVRRSGPPSAQAQGLEVAETS
jgi:hypothetical protein